MKQFDGTTILSVRRNGKVAVGGDGQDSMGDTGMKGNARKVRRLYNDQVIAGFAGGTADAFTLFERFEAELDKPMTTVDSAKLGKASRVVDASGRYIEFCKSTIPSRTTLKGLKMVVDCANGATYHVAPSVFHELGAEVTAIGVSPNGLNINLECGSTHPEQLQKIVREQGADVGIALDGDGDRVLMVDNSGVLLDGDELLFK